MARLVSMGFEGQDRSELTTSAGSLPIVTGRSGAGTYALFINGSGDNARRDFSTVNSFYLSGWYYRIGTSVTTTLALIQCRNGTTARVRLDTVASTNTLNLFINGATRISTALTTHQWNHIEIYVNLSTTGSCTLIVNGGTPQSASGNYGTAGINSLFGQGGTSRGMYWDDIFLNDTTGGSDNSWSGMDRAIYATYPVGDGTSNQWTNSAGNSINNWSYVDERPYSDVDYVSTGTQNYKDQYSMYAMSLSGKSISKLWYIARLRSSVASSVDAGFTVGGTDYLTNNVTGTSFANFISAIYSTNPYTSTTWSFSDIGSMQGVVSQPNAGVTGYMSRYIIMVEVIDAPVVTGIVLGPRIQSV